MIRAFKVIWNKFNVANELIKIIDGLQKENEKLKEDCLVFRSRAIEAEELVLKYEQQLRDAAIKRPHGITG